jgi:hypothetical protein
MTLQDLPVLQNNSNIKKYNIMKTLKTLLLVTFAGIMLFSCKKTEQIITPDDSLCAYIGTDSINKAAPIFNEFFDKLNVNLSDSLKLQSFVDWLKKHECIIGAEILSISGIYTLPPQSEIKITFSENGVTKQLILDISMSEILRYGGSHDTYAQM